MLSRRTNTRSPAEIEAAQLAFRCKSPDAVVRESAYRAARPKLTPEQRAERDAGVVQLWLSKSHTISEISTIAQCTQGLVRSIISEHRLWGKGGVRKSRITPLPEEIG